MIAFALPDDYARQIHPPEQAHENSLCFTFHGTKLLLTKDTRSLPAASEKALYFGTWQNKHLFAARIDTIPANHILEELRALHGHLDDGLYALAGRALQLLEWQTCHQFCGRCGTPTTAHPQELSRLCPSCGYLAYPRISPVIMVLIRRGPGEILLARGPHFPKGMFSLLAGFVDPGETLEQCVKREVFEEVGLDITNIRYFASQPWPFPHSLLIGFFADWQAGALKIDPVEIEEAGWFSIHNLPPLPSPFSLARQMINHIHI